MKNRFLTLQK